MQQRFGVAAGLFLALEDQIARRLVGHAATKVSGHELVSSLSRSAFTSVFSSSIWMSLTFTWW